MLEVLRKAILGRRYGPANVEHALRIERAIARVPFVQVDDAWRVWFWRLPPEAWKEALDLKRSQLQTMMAYQEVAVQAIMRKNELESILVRPEGEAKVDRHRIEAEFEAAVAEIEEIKFAIMDAELDVRARAFDFEERFGTPAQGPESRRAVLGQTAERWQAWLQAVPPERRRGAMRIRALYADRALYREELAATTAERDRMEAKGPRAARLREVEERIDGLKETCDRLDAMAQRLAPPLFDAVGTPDLSEGLGEGRSPNFRNQNGSPS